MRLKDALPLESWTAVGGGMAEANLVRMNLDEVVVERFFKNNQFFLVYQPKVSLAEPANELGLEAYLRLKMPGLETQSPALFMPVVRRMGLMPELTLVMFTTLAKDWLQIQASGSDKNIAVNLDIELLAQHGFLDTLEQNLKHSVMPLSRLHVDLVISGTIEISATILKGLERLRALGMRLAVEVGSDFSLNRKTLLALQVEELKLSRGLFAGKVSGAPEGLLAQCVEWAQHHDLVLTAVGVESEAEAQWLLQLGVANAQGFLYGAPTPIDPEQMGQTLTDTSEAPSIVVVDQGLNFLQQLKGFVPANYRIAGTSDLTKVPDLLDELKPGIVIFELGDQPERMFALADALPAADPSHPLVVLFVSAEENPQHYLNCYESNGFSYLYQTMPIVELLAGINRAINVQKTSRKVATELESSKGLALQSMRDAANYGDIVQLMKNICLAREERAISGDLFRFMRQRGLHCSVVFSTTEPPLSFDSVASHCSRTELNVFQLLKDRGRLYEFGSRIIVNGKYSAFLIKNLPEDETFKGQIRDYIAAIIECMDAQCQSIQQNRAIERAIGELMDISAEAVSTIDATAARKKQMINFLNSEISMSFHVLDLTVEQEDYLKNLVNKLLTESDAEEQGLAEITEHLQSTIEELKLRLLPASEPAAEISAAEDDVDLF